MPGEKGGRGEKERKKEKMVGMRGVSSNLPPGVRKHREQADRWEDAAVAVGAEAWRPAGVPTDVVGEGDLLELPVDDRRRGESGSGVLHAGRHLLGRRVDILGRTGSGAVGKSSSFPSVKSSINFYFFHVALVAMPPMSAHRRGHRNNYRDVSG